MNLEFSRDENGFHKVHVPEGYMPLANFLESDVQNSTEYGQQFISAIDEMKNGELSEWSQTGDSTTVMLKDGKAIIEHVHVPNAVCELELDHFKKAIADWLAFRTANK